MNALAHSNGVELILTRENAHAHSNCAEHVANIYAIWTSDTHHAKTFKHRAKLLCNDAAL